MLINIVDGRQLDKLFECFAAHERAKTDIDYDQLYKDLHKTTTPKQSYMDYQASSSVQRRGALKIIIAASGGCDAHDSTNAITFNEIPLHGGEPKLHGRESTSK